MALNPSIILAGQQFDLAGSMGAGNQLAAQTNQLRDQNALRDVYRTQGAGILQGNQGSLNALAADDPAQAMQMQAGQLDMQATRQRIDMLSREEQRQLAAAKASMTAAEAAAAAAQIEDAVKMGLAIQDPAQWDAVMAQQAPDLVGQFNNRQALAMKYMSMAEVLKANAPPEAPDPVKGAPSGYKWADPANPGAGVVPLPGFERSSGVTINTGDTGAQMGTIPQGFVAVQDPTSPAGYRMMPIPGGPEDTAGADAASAASTARTADVVLEDINRLKTLVQDAPIYSPAAGFGAQRLAEFGGTNAADAAALAETIGANIGFDRLQAMREASPTGGALGNVTERELQALRSVLGSIELSQSPQQLVENLTRLEKMYQGIMAKAAAYPNASQFGFEGAAAPSAAPGEMSDDDLLKMYGG